MGNAGYRYRGYGVDFGAVNETISPNDAMFRASSNAESYLAAGKTVADTLKAATELASIEPKKILDYGCGHGRVLRWLQNYWPDAELTAADIMKSQVEFCAETFGTNPFLIARRFSEIELPGVFDMIWLGSIFTHMSRSCWDDLIDSLVDSLKPGGLFCFSFAGRHVYDLWKSGNLRGIEQKDQSAALKALLDYEAEGFGFFAQDNQKDEVWGRSIAKPELVMDLCFKRGGKIVLFSEQAYASRQDIICVQFTN